MHKVALPKFDANTLEATLGPWRKREGERVEKGDVLVDVITDKANFELEAEAPGILRRILAPERSEVPLGYVVALVGAADEPLLDVGPENERMMKEYLASVTGKSAAAKVPGPQAAPPTDRVRATPRARRLAREGNIDLAALQKRIGVEVVTEEHVQRQIEEGRS